MMRSFWSKVDAVEAWHAKLVDKPWLQPLKPTKFVLVLIVLSTLVAAGMNWYVRHWQYQVWEQNPEVFYLDDGTPLFTTTDAPYFLGLAKAIKDEGNFQAFNEKRTYPKYEIETGSHTPSSSLRDAPLLSVILSFISTDSSQKSLLQAGNALIPITAALTALMVVFAFGAAGYWLAGTIAAAGGALSFSYLTRSGAGRIDTDQLNLGFFYLMTGLVIFAARAKSQIWAYLLTLGAAAAFWVFDWWYSQSFFGWAFLIGLIWLSLVSSQNLKRVVLQAILFLAVSGLGFQGFGINSDSSYLSDTSNYEGLIFPNTFETITELKTVGLGEILSRISGTTWFGVLSLAGLCIWGLRHPALAIVFGPAAAFALLNFLVGNRAIFYSAPMLWFGFGWGLVTLAQFCGQRFGPAKLNNVGVMVSLVIGFSAVWLASPTRYIQGPTFDRNIVQAFKNLEQVTLTNDAVVATWWDYGYMSMFINQMPTFHDGGSQTSTSTFFIANSLLSTSQERAADRLDQLKKSGGNGVIKSLVGKGQADDSEARDRALFLILTKDMSNWIPSISAIGRWDIFTGKPKPLGGVPADYQLTYEKLSCQQGTRENQVICNGVPVDVRTGRFGNQAILDGMAIARDGRQLSGQKFKNASSPLMMHSEIGERGKANMLIHRDLYFSVFHQLFHAGRHDERYFELVYDDYPDVRVFRVKTP